MNGYRWWVVGRRWSTPWRPGEPFAYDTGSDDEDQAKAVLSDVLRWSGVAEATLEKREVPA